MQTDRYSGAQSRSQTFDAGLRAHMSSVYNRMTIGVLITAITAWIVSSSPDLMTLFLGGPQKYIVIFAPLAIVWFGFNPMTMSSQKLKLAFIGVSVLYGISFSAIAFAFAGAEIARAFFITSGMFAGLSIFGYTTKKDLSALGTFCMMGVIGVVLTSVIGIFVGFSDTMQIVLSAITVVVFAGLTAWETQNTKQMYNASHSAELNSRLAWSSALSLYISFVVMFSHILSLMQER
ncbi:MAG: Bax inhibitor-1/YccA family protein [Alphaproteobacteria bacterium]